MKKHTKKTIIILANSGDPNARVLGERWGADRARLMTPHDLSMPGWIYQPGMARRSVAMASGQKIVTTAIQGVITRLTWVYEHDVAHIVPRDRAYVAAEMNAFLLSWLTELPCPVLNRPTPTGLSGPWWRHEKWKHEASRAGFSLAPTDHSDGLSTHTASFYGPPSVQASITMVGKRQFGEAPKAVVRRARLLAESAGTDMLTVYFNTQGSNYYFVRASPICDEVTHEIADAIHQYLSQDT